MVQWTSWRWFSEPVAERGPVHHRSPERLRRHSPVPGADPPARWRHARSVGRPDAGRHRIARGHDRSDLHPARGLVGRALVGTCAGREPSRDPGQRQAHLQRRRESRQHLRRVRWRHRRVLCRNGGHHAVCRLRVTQRLRHGPSQRAPRRRRSPSEQPRRQALVRREWRPRSAVPDVDGRAVPVAPLSRRRRDRIPAATGGGTRDVVVAEGQGRGGRVPRRSPARTAAGHA